MFKMIPHYFINVEDQSVTDSSIVCFSIQACLHCIDRVFGITVMLLSLIFCPVLVQFGIPLLVSFP